MARLTNFSVSVLEMSKEKMIEKKMRQKSSLFQSPDKGLNRTILDELNEEWKRMTESREILHGSMASCFFSRQQIFDLYTRFKSLSQLSAIQTP